MPVPPSPPTSLPVLLLAGLAACTTPPAEDALADATAPRTQGTEIRLTPAQSAAIGRKIWQNECGGTVDGLTSWNRGEDFASLGIGHFIWYPKGGDGPFEESFPALVRYLEARRIPMPRWLATTPDCPWPDREAFLRDFQSPRMRELRGFLRDSVPHQTGFIVRRLERALPKMLAATAPANRDAVRRRFYQVAESPNGVYALIDYVNFKGEGTNPAERYKGQGWGLLQVLESMQPSPGGPAAAAEFSESAARVLRRRVANSPPARNEQRWLAGWLNRCAGYARPFTS